MVDTPGVETLEAARSAVRSVPAFAGIADRLEALLEPAIRVDMVPGPFEPTGSRFGGSPVMSPGDAWPVRTREPYLGRVEPAETFTVAYGEPEGVPLTFLGQVNLGE